jgi:hypothetical protein
MHAGDGVAAESRGEEELGLQATVCGLSIEEGERRAVPSRAWSTWLLWMRVRTREEDDKQERMTRLRLRCLMGCLEPVAQFRKYEELHKSQREKTGKDIEKREEKIQQNNFLKT